MEPLSRRTVAILEAHQWAAQLPERERALQVLEAFQNEDILGSVMFERMRPLLDADAWAELASRFPKEHQQWQKHGPLLPLFGDKSATIAELITRYEAKRITAFQLVEAVHRNMCVESRFFLSQELWVEYPAIWAALEVAEFPLRKWRQDRERKAARKQARPVPLSTGRFTTDVLDLIKPHIPLPSLGRMARTSVFIHTRLTVRDMQMARERARVTFGQFTVQADGSIVLHSTNEETLSIRTFGVALFRVVLGGVDYIGENSYDGQNLRTNMTRVLQGQADGIKIWFRMRDMPYIQIFFAMPNTTRDSSFISITAI